MKKYLIIAFAICVLFLSACGSLVETSTPAMQATTPTTGPIATASSQNACQGLRNQQAQLGQQYQTASAQLSTAQAAGNLQQGREAEKRLIRLRQSLAQAQAQLKLCYKNVG